MSVTSLGDYRRGRSPEREAHMRRLALQLAVQLPADTGDALDCLDMAKTAVRSFLAAAGPSSASRMRSNRSPTASHDSGSRPAMGGSVPLQEI